MRYEEKFINGKTCFRTQPTGAWHPLSVAQARQALRHNVKISTEYMLIQDKIQKAIEGYEMTVVVSVRFIDNTALLDAIVSYLHYQGYKVCYDRTIDNLTISWKD